MKRQVEEARREAAKPVKDRIQRDRERSDGDVNRFLAALEKRLFDDVALGAILKAAGIIDKNFAETFYGASKVKPLAYRRRARVETLDRLLKAGLGLPTADLCDAVGLGEFSTARSHFRALLGRSLPLLHSGQMDIEFSYFTHALLRLGRLQPCQARALCKLLLALPKGTSFHAVRSPPQGPTEVIEWAIGQVRSRIDVDIERVSKKKRLKDVLKVIAANITNPKLNAAFALSEAGISDRVTDERFKFYFAATISCYIDKRLTETMLPILGETDLRVRDIGDRFDFPDDRRLKAVLRRATGQTQTQEVFRNLPPSVDLETWLLSGMGEPSAVLAVKAILRRLTRPTRKEPQNLALIESLIAEKVVWPTIRELPLPDLVKEVRRPLFIGHSFVEFLRKRSQREGRRDRERGKTLSVLALEAVHGTALQGDALLEEEAKGWALVCNSKRLSLDLLGAKKAIRKAFGKLDDREHGVESDAVVYVCDRAISLRIFERRYDDSLSLADRAICIAKELGDFPVLIKLNMMKASVLAYLERYDASAALLFDSRTALPKVHNKARRLLLEFKLDVFLATALARSRRFDAAVEAIAAARKYEGPIDLEVAGSLLDWIEAFIDHGKDHHEAAEHKYCAILSGLGAGEILTFALVSLDLAILYSETDRPAKVIECCLPTLPVFASLPLHQETMVGLKLIETAISQTPRVSREVLVAFRSSLWRDPLVTPDLIGVKARLLTSLDS